MKRDLVDYLLNLQKQEDDMQKAVEQADDLLKEGLITQEQAENIINYMNTIHSNYQRVLYCKYLYELPPKFIQKIQQKKLNKKLAKFIEEKADKETIYEENKEAQEGIEDIVKKAEEIEII